MKKHFPLIAGITIPILLILFVAGSIYIPGIFVHPKYNFVYETGGNYGRMYYVANGALQENVVTTTTPYPPGVPTGQPQLYLYDVTANTAKAISFDDAKKLSLDPSPQSPDGFQVVNGGSGGGSFPFFYSSSNYYTHYIQGGTVSKKLNIPSTEPYYENFTFLGWVNE